MNIRVQFYLLLYICIRLIIIRSIRNRIATVLGLGERFPISFLEGRGKNTEYNGKLL